MKDGASKDMVYKISDDIVVRKIEGEIIIVPLTVSVGDLDDGLYTLNETARAFWEKIDGTHTLANIASQLSQDFDAPAKTIQHEVLGLAAELSRLKMIVPVSPTENR